MVKLIVVGENSELMILKITMFNGSSKVSHQGKSRFVKHWKLRRCRYAVKLN